MLKDRQLIVSKLEQEQFDILIIGGGITGAGIALDAASRGLKTALIEKSSFANGTSSRSTKLIHGGLRYLKNLEFKIVRDTGRERAIAYANAPHLVCPEKLLLPIYKNGTYSKLSTSIALWVYDRMAGVVKKDRRKMLNKIETIEHSSLIKKTDLKGSGYYSEYRTDDSRLTIEIINTARMNHAICCNYIEAKSFIVEQNKMKGIKAFDHDSGKEITINAKKIINASGPWSDDVRLFEDKDKNKNLILSKGTHIVLPISKISIRNSMYFDVADGRMIFAIKRHDVVYIGTTDTFYNSDIESVSASLEDINYLINACNEMFPNTGISKNDIISSWSGLRPLIFKKGKKAGELSRKDEVFISESGLITITGGKLTGYRLMAKKVVDMIIKDLKLSKKCSTHNIKINGYMSDQEISSFIKSKSDIEAEKSIRKFGSSAQKIYSKSKKETILNEAQHCIKNELCIKLVDFYGPYTGRILFDPSSVRDSLSETADYFQSQLHWDEQRKSLEISEVEEDLKQRISFS